MKDRDNGLGTRLVLVLIAFAMSIVAVGCSGDKSTNPPNNTNQAPQAPSNPTPANSATNQSTTATLSWQCSDPDNDPLTYDVSFGSTNPPASVSSSQSTATYDPGPLTANTTYYWKVTAKDDQSHQTAGAVWSFATGAASNTVTDYDGNVYHTVQIGTQVWMVENLRVTHYRNGGAIPQAGTLPSLQGEYWNFGEVTVYGRLYNWYAAINQLAPTGWHIPTDVEWQTLSDYLGGITVAGGKLKEAGYAHWAVPNTGATNQSGFTALPAGKYGYIYTTDPFHHLDSIGYFWSATTKGATPPDSSSAWYRSMSYNSAALTRSAIEKKGTGLSVRCVKD